jgi:IclR family acetate operon transcriptional repressor
MRNDEGASAVQSVDRALRILEALASESRPRSLQELSRALGCSATTIHRLLSTLQQYDYVEKDPETRRYGIGLGILRLTDARDRHADVRGAALPLMERLRELSGESVGLNLLVGQRFICAERLESFHRLRWTTPIGLSVPLERLGASAMALLAYLPPADRLAVLAKVDWTRVRLTRGEVETELNAIRQRGITRSFGTWQDGTSSIAATIRGQQGAPRGVLSISGPLNRWTAERMDPIEKELLAAAQELSIALGYRPSVSLVG